MCFFKYQTAQPYEILLIFGAGNKNIKLKRKSLIWPGQTCMALNTGLITCNFEVTATSSEKFSLLIPTSFAIGPWTQDKASMLKYAKFMSRTKSFPYDDVKKLLGDTIQGEVRALAASMTNEEISKGSNDFMDIVDRAQLRLSKFGIFIYFAYINNCLVYTREQMGAIGLFKTKVEDANVSLYENQKSADASLYAKEKEAEGTKAVEEARGLYTATLLKALGGNYGYVRSYMRHGGRLSRLF